MGRDLQRLSSPSPMQQAGPSSTLAAHSPGQYDLACCQRWAIYHLKQGNLGHCWTNINAVYDYEVHLHTASAVLVQFKNAFTVYCLLKQVEALVQSLCMAEICLPSEHQSLLCPHLWFSIPVALLMLEFPEMLRSHSAFLLGRGL